MFFIFVFQTSIYFSCFVVKLLFSWGYARHNYIVFGCFNWICELYNFVGYFVWVFVVRYVIGTNLNNYLCRLFFLRGFNIVFHIFNFCAWGMLLSQHVSLHKKIKFSIKDSVSKYDQTCSLLRIWSHLLEKSLTENFIFCAVFLMLYWFRNSIAINVFYNWVSKVTVVGALVLVFEMIDFRGCESVSFWIYFSSNSLSLSSVAVLNASKQLGETNCEILFNVFIFNGFSRH